MSYNYDTLDEGALFGYMTNLGLNLNSPNPSWASMIILKEIVVVSFSLIFSGCHKIVKQPVHELHLLK